MNIVKSVFRLLLGSRLPITAGTLPVSGLRQAVLIRRDEYGIPYIEAQEDQDAWFGIGFCHGQDRAFQIESLLRVVRGTMSELVGPAVLPIDRLSRRIGFAHAAEQQWPLLDEEIRQMLEAYAQGVNQGCQVGCRQSAHEFALLGSQPTPFRGTDVLGVMKLMAFTLPSNWDVELARLKILADDGPEALQALDPVYPEWLTVTNPPTLLAGKAVNRLADDLAIFKATLGQGGGSNNWVIAPSRTATGRPILANDPHLAPSLPSYWYLASIRTPRWHVGGAAFVGSPVFPVGHNDTAAWGMTAGLIDNTDLFVEQIGADGRSVRHGDEFVPCEVRKEIIRVKGGKPVEEDVLITPHGPLIGPALEGEVGAISLRAIWLDSRPIRGLFQIYNVKSYEEFRHVFAQWPSLPLHLVYADTAGTIGWQLVGEAPQRRKGCGTLPLPGRDLETGWREETVPFESMPHLANPDAGFIATANNQPAQEKDGPFLGMDWIDGYRVARITEMLDARRDWDLAGTQALQMDWTSIPWRELRDILLSAPADTAKVRQALDLLKAWDGVIAADSPAATLYEFFWAEMVQRVTKAKAPRAYQWALGKCVTPLAPYSLFATRRFGHLIRLLRSQPAGWFAHSWPQEMAEALATVITTLRNRYGNDPARWAWGRVRPLTLRHAVGGQAPLDKVFNLGPFPWGGDSNTVGQAAADPLDPSANSFCVASLRMVLDVGNWDENRFVFPGGQSGNPLSPHYDDFLARWQRNDGISIAWSPAKVEQATRSTLRLVGG